jgi:two-component system NarL family response regulator
MSAGGGGIRVLLADEHSLFREAVRVVLDQEPDIDVVAEVSDGRQAIAEAERVRPDVALVDVHLPNCDGIRVAATLAECVPACRTLVVDGSEDETTLIRSLEAGAMGYVAKTRPLSELLDAARSVDRGETVVPPRMLGGLLARLVHHRREQDRAIRLLVRLTIREREVLALLADGAGNDEIARQLVISPQTARTHIQNVLGKLGMHSRLEAAMWVNQHRVLADLVAAE